jgi:hypothetical membrane protein
LEEFLLIAWLIQYSKYFGVTGCLIIILGVIIPGITYIGKKKERFSLLNHFISELGELGVSRNAPIFNLGLILGGILLIPFIIGLGLELDSVWGKFAILAGVWTSISAMCVGFFPMNNLEPHTKAAVSYFRSGLVTVLCFGLAIQLQPAGHLLIPKAANLISLVTLFAFLSFLLLLNKRWGKDQNLDALNPQLKKERPRIWILPLIEWLVYFCTILWFFGMALLM